MAEVFPIKKCFPPFVTLPFTGFRQKTGIWAQNLQFNVADISVIALKELIVHRIPVEPSKSERCPGLSVPAQAGVGGIIFAFGCFRAVSGEKYAEMVVWGSKCGFAICHLQ